MLDENDRLAEIRTQNNNLEFTLQTQFADICVLVRPNVPFNTSRIFVLNQSNFRNRKRKSSHFDDIVRISRSVLFPLDNIRFRRLAVPS